jgi:hypothetical protein
MGFDYYTPQQVDPLAPARRASNMMYVLGGLLLLLGTCIGGFVLALPELMKQPEFARAMQQTPELMSERFRTTGLVQSAALVVLGIVLVVLAIIVRRGGKGAAITAMVLASLVTLYLSLELVVLVARGGQLPAPAVCGASCFLGLPLVLFALLLAMLIQAYRAAEQVRFLREQYAQQYWQHAYQQQMFQQPGMPPQQPPVPPQGPGEPRA